MRVETDITIDATAGDVWRVLMRFDEYPDWNPFVRAIEGVPRVGERLRVLLQQPGARAMTFRPRVVAADAPREFRWLGHVLIPGLFDGEHAFEVEPLPDGRVRFVQSERFTGVLLPLLRRTLEQNTRRGFEAMNDALKERVEGSRTP
jgi:hypothetical protein